MFNLLHITHCGNLKFYIVFCCCWKRIDSLMTVIDLPLTSDDKVTVICLFIVSFGWSVWPVICYLKVKVCVLINQSFWISSAWSFCCASAIRIALSFFLLLLFPITRLLLSNLCVFFPQNQLYILCLAYWLQVPWFKSIYDVWVFLTMIAHMFSHLLFKQACQANNASHFSSF